MMMQFNMRNVESSYHTEQPTNQSDEVRENAVDNENQALANEKRTRENSSKQESKRICIDQHESGSRVNARLNDFRLS